MAIEKVNEDVNLEIEPAANATTEDRIKKSSVDCRDDGRIC